MFKTHTYIFLDICIYFHIFSACCVRMSLTVLALSLPVCPAVWPRNSQCLSLVIESQASLTAQQLPTANCVCVWVYVCVCVFAKNLHAFAHEGSLARRRTWLRIKQAEPQQLASVCVHSCDNWQLFFFFIFISVSFSLSLLTLCFALHWSCCNFSLLYCACLCESIVLVQF